jgi:hypothetical protein
MEIAEPDLPGVCKAFNAAGASYVVIGGFAVITNGYVLETLEARDRNSGQPPGVEFITERGGGHYHTICGDLDLLAEGLAPLDFAEIHESALHVELEGVPITVADLAHLVAFKRLAGRPQDRSDLQKLGELHGPLPMLPLPGVDS